MNEIQRKKWENGLWYFVLATLILSFAMIGVIFIEIFTSFDTPVVYKKHNVDHELKITSNLPPATVFVKPRHPDQKLLISMGSKLKVTQNEDEQLTELFGTPVTNNLGIPDYYVSLIESNIPESNSNAREAALKMVYYRSLSLLAVTTTAMIYLNSKSETGFDCVSYYMVHDAKKNLFINQYTYKYPSKKIELLSQRVNSSMAGIIEEDRNESSSLSNEDLKKVCEDYVTH